MSSRIVNHPGELAPSILQLSTWLMFASPPGSCSSRNPDAALLVPLPVSPQLLSASSSCPSSLRWPTTDQSALDTHLLLLLVLQGCSRQPICLPKQPLTIEQQVCSIHKEVSHCHLTSQTTCALKSLSGRSVTGLPTRCRAFQTCSRAGFQLLSASAAEPLHHLELMLLASIASAISGLACHTECYTPAMPSR